MFLVLFCCLASIVVGQNTDEQFLTPPESVTTFGDQFGRSIDVSEEARFIVAGAPHTDYIDRNGKRQVDTGAAYIFKRQGKKWNPERIVPKDRNGEPTKGAEFGYTVAIDANATYVAVGSVSGDSPSVPLAGNVKFFVREYNEEWQEESWFQVAQYLFAEDGGADDKFGGALAMDSQAEWVAVGAPACCANAKEVARNRIDNKGAVYVFRRFGRLRAAKWVFQEKLEVPEIVQKAWTEREVKVNNAWKKVKGYLTTEGPTEHASFGQSVAMSPDGQIIVVGAYMRNQPDPEGGPELNKAGSAFIFRRLPGTSKYEPWQILGAELPTPIALFGSAVAIDSSWRIAIGSRGERVDFAVSAGAAFIYEFVGTVDDPETPQMWENMITEYPFYISPALPEGAQPIDRMNEKFGHAVSIYGNTLWVGTYDYSVDESVNTYYFKYDPLNKKWEQKPPLQDAADPLKYKPNEAKFGFAIKQWRDYAVVGCPNDEDDRDLTNKPNTPGYVFVLVSTDQQCNGYGIVDPYVPGECTCDSGHIPHSPEAKKNNVPVCINCDNARGYFGAEEIENRLTTPFKCLLCNGHGEWDEVQKDCVCHPEYQTNGKTKCKDCAEYHTLGIDVDVCVGVVELKAYPNQGLLLKTVFTLEAATGNGVQYYDDKGNITYSYYFATSDNITQILPLDTTDSPVYVIETDRSLPKGVIKLFVEVRKDTRLLTLAENSVVLSVASDEYCRDIVEKTNEDVGLEGLDTSNPLVCPEADKQCKCVRWSADQCSYQAADDGGEMTCALAGGGLSSQLVDHSKALTNGDASVTQTLTKILQAIALVNSLGDQDIDAQGKIDFRTQMSEIVALQLRFAQIEVDPDEGGDIVICNPSGDFLSPDPIQARVEFDHLLTVMETLIQPGEMNRRAVDLVLCIDEFIVHRNDPDVHPQTLRVFQLQDQIEASLLDVIDASVKENPDWRNGVDIGLGELGDMLDWYSKIAIKEFNFTHRMVLSWRGDYSGKQVEARRVKPPTEFVKIAVIDPNFGRAEVVVPTSNISGFATSEHIDIVVVSQSNPFPEPDFQQVGPIIRMLQFDAGSNQLTKMLAPATYRMDYVDSFARQEGHCLLFMVRALNLDQGEWDIVSARERIDWFETNEMPTCPAKPVLDRGPYTVWQNKAVVQTTRPRVEMKSTELQEFGVFMVSAELPPATVVIRERPTVFKWDKVVFLFLGYGCFYVLVSFLLIWGITRDIKVERKQLAIEREIAQGYRDPNQASVLTKILRVLQTHAYLAVAIKTPNTPLDIPTRVFNLSTALAPMALVIVHTIPIDWRTTTMNDAMRCAIYGGLVAPAVTIIMRIISLFTQPTVRKGDGNKWIILGRPPETHTWFERVQCQTDDSQPRVRIDEQGDFDYQRGGPNPWLVVAQAQYSEVLEKKLDDVKGTLTGMRKQYLDEERKQKKIRNLKAKLMMAREEDDKEKLAVIEHELREFAERRADDNKQYDDANDADDENNSACVVEIDPPPRLLPITEPERIRAAWVIVVGHIIELILLSLAVVLPIVLGDGVWTISVFCGATVVVLAVGGILATRKWMKAASLLLWLWSQAYSIVLIVGFFHHDWVAIVLPIVMGFLMSLFCLFFLDGILNRPYMAMALYFTTQVTFTIIPLLTDEPSVKVRETVITIMLVSWAVAMLFICRVRLYVKNKLRPRNIPTRAKWVPFIIGVPIHLLSMFFVCMKTAEENNEYGKLYFSYAVLLGISFHFVFEVAAMVLWSIASLIYQKSKDGPIENLFMKICRVFSGVFMG